MSVLSKMSDKINKFAEIVVGILLFCMTVIIFAQVVYRYVLKASLPWSEELARYMMIYLSFWGTSIGVKRGSLIGVEALISCLSKENQRRMAIVGCILGICFFVVLILNGTNIVKVACMQVSPAMKINMGYAYFAIVSGGVFMLIHALNNISILCFKKEAK